MLIEEITEGFLPTFGTKGNKTVRKYRCTSGARKGRIVAKPSTCTAPKNVPAAQRMKSTRRKQKSVIAVKSKQTKRNNPSSRRLKSVNKSRTIKSRNRSIKRKKI